jgi:hypothetical protein
LNTPSSLYSQTSEGVRRLIVGLYPADQAKGSRLATRSAAVYLAGTVGATSAAAYLRGLADEIGAGANS